MGNEQSTQNQAENQAQAQQKNQMHASFGKVGQGNINDTDEHGVDEYNQVRESIKKPNESGVSFRQNPLNIQDSQASNQLPSGQQTAYFTNQDGQNQQNQNDINSFRDNIDRQKQQNLQESVKRGSHSQSKQLPRSSYSLKNRNVSQQQEGAESLIHNQSINSQVQLKPFHQNEHGEYEDPNANYIMSVQQERKNIIIMEQLDIQKNYMQSQDKKLTSEETDLLVYNLLQKGKDIEYRTNMLKQKYDDQEVEECNFQPSGNQKGEESRYTSKNQHQSQSKSLNASQYQSLAQRKPNRDLNQFLKDQNEFQNKRAKQVKELEEKEKLKEVEGYTGKPQLCHRSEAILRVKNEESGKRNGPTYKRLYNMNKSKQEQAKQKKLQEQENMENSKIEKISAAFQKNRIKEDATNRLYDDFKRREEKYKDQEQFFSKRKVPTESSTQQTNTQKKNDLCLAKKLLKEFDACIQILQGDLDKPLQILDYIQASELLKLMSYTTEHTRVESANFIKERSLINDLWIILEGQKLDYITGRNLILALLGIMGINVDIPQLKLNPQQLQQQQELLKQMRLQNSNFQQQPQYQPAQPQSQTQIDKAIPLARDSDILEEQREINFQHQKNIKEQRLIQSQIRQSQIEHQKASHILEPNMNNSNGTNVAAKNEHELSQQNMSSHSQQPFQQEHTPMNYMDDYVSVDASAQKPVKLEDMDDYYNQRYRELVVGSFDEDHNLCLEDSDIKRLQNHFHALYINKLNYSKKVANLQNPQQPQPSHNASMMSVKSQKTDMLAYNHRQKLLEVARMNYGGDVDKLTNYDLMLAHKEIRKKNAEIIKEMREEQEMEECTFAPKVKNYQPNHQQSSEFQGDMQPYQNEEGSEIKNYKKPMTTQSLGSERYMALYKLGKPRSQFRDKMTDEVDYEKNCDECTFTPNITSNRAPSQNQKYIYVKDGDATVNRIRTAYDKDTSDKKFINRGYDFFIDKNPKQYQSVQLSTSGKKNMSQRKSPNSYISGLRNINRYGSVNPPDQFKPEYTFGHDRIPGQQFNNNNQEEEEEQMHGQDNQENNHYEERSNSQQYTGTDNNVNTQENEEDGVPMLYVDVNLSADRVERIIVRKTDNIEDVAEQFINKHQLDMSIKEKLVELLNQQISQFMSQN